MNRRTVPTSFTRWLTDFGPRWSGKYEQFESGAAYVFTRSAGIWTEQQELLPSAGRLLNDWFGHSVSVSGDTAVIGARLDDTYDPAGAAYVFTRSAGVWTEEQRLLASDLFGQDGVLGVSVSVSGDTAAVGAQLDDVLGVSVNSASCSSGYPRLTRLTGIDTAVTRLATAGPPRMQPIVPRLRWVG